MTALRSWAGSRAWLALCLLALALAAKLLVPAGTMPMPGQALTVALCTGAGMADQRAAMPSTELPAKVVHHRHAPGKGEKGAPCPFAAMAHVAATYSDPAVLLAAIAFVLALSFAPIAGPALVRRTYLRPPLRGPPSPA